MLCNIYEGNANMKWFNLYAYDPIIDGSIGKYAFTRLKKEIYYENGGTIDYYSIINDAIFKDFEFVKTYKEFLDNIVGYNEKVNYKGIVNNLLKDSERINLDSVPKFIKDTFGPVSHNVLPPGTNQRPKFNQSNNYNGLRKGGIEETQKYSLNQLSNTTLTYILFYKHLTETKKQNNMFISFVCTYIKYLLIKEYEEEEKEDKKLFIKKLVKFFNGKIEYYYKLGDNINNEYYKSWYEETQEFKSMFDINANRFINQLDFEHSFIDYIDLYYAILFISKNNYFDVKKLIKTLKENKTELDNNNYVNVYKIIFKSIKDTNLSYLDYDFIFLICHFVILLYKCSITNKQFEEILEQNDVRATKLIKIIIEKYNKENLFKEIEGSEINYNIIDMCNNILKKNELIGEETKGPLSALDELRKKLGFVDKSIETSYEDSLSIENKLTKNLFDISEPSNKNGLNVNMERAGGSSSSEELF